jgi:glycosyltransferase involved in cell wall biosynthesis
MKILQIHNKYVYKGGEDSVVEEEANLLRKNGNSVFQLFKNNKDISSIKDKLLTLYNLSYSKYSIEYLKEELLKIEKPDIVHVHNTYPLWTYSIFEFLNEKKIPIVMTLHNYRLVWDSLSFFDNDYMNYGCFNNSKFQTFFISKIINKNKKNILFKNIDKFITLTEFTKKKFIDAKVPIDKLLIKPNFLPNKEGNFQSITNKQNAIFASRVSKEKGILTLLKSWKDIEIKINIYGDGPLLNKIKKNSKNIQFHGNCSRDLVSDEINKSKFLIFPSEWFECMPMTILESFRAGTLVLASNIGSIPNIIKDGYNGILFNPNDPSDIKEKVNWVLNNPQKCDEISINAMNDFNNKYSEEVNYKMLMKIYNGMITDKLSKN